MKDRDLLNGIVLENADHVLKRLYSLDSAAFRDGGRLGAETKELVALAVSLALRCDDCVTYHLARCADLGVPTPQLAEAMGIASLIGGTITIPHVRRAFAAWMEMKQKSPGADFDSVLENLREVVREGGAPEGVLAAAAGLMKDSIPGYDWVGFYLCDPVTPGTLVLGPFSGAPTEHVRIGFGRGVCGRAAELGRTLVVDDVTRESEYLACSPEVKSEAVVPVFSANGTVVGELDIDSHERAAFTQADRDFLEKAAAALSPFVEAAAAALQGGGGA
ncbi:GAF domain-containing protein [Candidatus Fermentibacteria bacterium]|nr:GAF domain-containing protein [Candidatus Fermentibacteria bacterium]